MQIRNISKGKLGVNLRKKPALKTKVRKDFLGRFAYLRFGFNWILSVINPFTRRVCSVRRYHKEEMQKEKEKNK